MLIELSDKERDVIAFSLRAEIAANGRMPPTSRTIMANFIMREIIQKLTKDDLQRKA